MQSSYSRGGFKGLDQALRGYPGASIGATEPKAVQLMVT